MLGLQIWESDAWEAFAKCSYQIQKYHFPDLSPSILRSSQSLSKGVPVQQKPRKLAMWPAAECPWPFLGLAGTFLASLDHVCQIPETGTLSLVYIVALMPPHPHCVAYPSRISLSCPPLGRSSLICQGLPQMWLCHSSVIHWFLFCVALAVSPPQLLVAQMPDHLLFVFLNTNTAPAPQPDVLTGPEWLSRSRGPLASIVGLEIPV